MAKCTWITDTIYDKDGSTTTVNCGAKTALKTKLCPTHIILMKVQLEQYAMDIRSGKEEPIDL